MSVGERLGLAALLILCAWLVFEAARLLVTLTTPIG